jgi:hypothetical protein
MFQHSTAQFCIVRVGEGQVRRDNAGVVWYVSVQSIIPFIIEGEEEETICNILQIQFFFFFFFFKFKKVVENDNNK